MPCPSHPKSPCIGKAPEVNHKNDYGHNETKSGTAPLTAKHHVTDFSRSPSEISLIFHIAANIKQSNNNDDNQLLEKIDNNYMISIFSFEILFKMRTSIVYFLLYALKFSNSQDQEDEIALSDWVLPVGLLAHNPVLLLLMLLALGLASKSDKSNNSAANPSPEGTHDAQAVGKEHKEVETQESDTTTTHGFCNLPLSVQAAAGNESAKKNSELDLPVLQKSGLLRDLTPAVMFREVCIHVMGRVLSTTADIFHTNARLFLTLLPYYQKEMVSAFFGCELNRVASFRTWQRERRPSALMMSSAGFFFTERNDEITCFSCGLTLGRWAPGMHPLFAHRELSRGLCKFVMNPAESGNIAMGKLSTPKGFCRDTVVNQTLQSSQTTASGSASDFHTSPSCQLSAKEKSATYSGRRNPSSCSHLQSLLPDGVSVVVISSRSLSATSTLRISQDHSQYHEDSVKLEAFRLSTYENVWNYSNIVSPADLARSGFFYTGVSDRVQCAFCQGILRNWEVGDIAAEQHARHFTYCRFVQGHDVENFPIPFTPLVIGTAEIVIDTVDERANLGITRPTPKYPDLAVEARRMSTFTTWPNWGAVKPETLVKAGFFFTGKQDEVKCFYCDGTKMDWEQQDDAWIEHARRFPSCQYVIQVKGPEFITQHNIERSGNIANAQTKTLPVDPREIRARMDSPKVRILLQMDYPLDLIREVVQKRLATVGSDHETSEDLLADIFAVHDEKQAAALRNSATASSNATTYPVVTKEPHDAAGSAATSLRTEIRQQDNSTNSILPANVGAQAASLILPTAMPVPSATAISPGDENQQLKTQLICKMCMDAVIGIVFLPCGHFVSCPECAPALSKCPICRVDIRGTVRSIV